MVICYIRNVKHDTCFPWQGNTSLLPIPKIACPVHQPHHFHFPACHISPSTYRALQVDRLIEYDPRLVVGWLKRTTKFNPVSSSDCKFSTTGRYIHSVSQSEMLRLNRSNLFTPLYANILLWHWHTGYSGVTGDSLSIVTSLVNVMGLRVQTQGH